MSTGSKPAVLPPSFKKAGVVYALTIDADDTAAVRRVLEPHGFRWGGGNLYLGDPEVNAIGCVLTAMELIREPGFAASVRGMRMLRIEEMNDLMPLVRRLAGDAR